MTTPEPIWHGSWDAEAMTELGRASMAGLLGIRFAEIGPDWVSATMPVDERTRQPFGMLHGGASVVLAETIASVAGQASVDGTRQRIVGMEINANHVRPVPGGHVHARATIEAKGRRTQIWSIRITDDRGRLACLSRITLAVIDVGAGAPVT